MKDYSEKPLAREGDVFISKSYFLPSREKSRRRGSLRARVSELRHRRPALISGSDLEDLISMDRETYGWNFELRDSRRSSDS